jgi:hypothetical protein
MISVTADAGETKPIAAVAVANCRNLNADLTTLSLMPRATAFQISYTFYICAPWDRQDSSSFRHRRAEPTIDDHPAVGNS